jgi:phage-related protein
MPVRKKLVFVGDSKRRYDEFPEHVQDLAGYELYRLQAGLQPSDFKPMPSIGSGVEELRIRDHHNNAYRVIYIARLRDAVYVLHTFQKKTQRTDRRDIDLARQRLRELLKEH